MPPKTKTRLGPGHTLDHARHDRVHCLAPGLFRSLGRGQRKGEKLYVTYIHPDGRCIEFAGPEPLGVDDMRVLQGLVAMAGPHGLILDPDTPETEDGRQIRARLFTEPEWQHDMGNAVVVRGSFRQLAREIGYADTENFRSIRNSIERMWMVSIIVRHDGRADGYRLLASYGSDERTGQLVIGLNPLIASSVFGHSPHIRIDLSEARLLKTDQARLLHQRLSAYVNPGSSHPSRIRTDTLCRYVWPEDTTSGSALRMRRKRIREALHELGNLGWQAQEIIRDKWLIGRPASGRQPRFHGDASPVLR